MAAFAKPPTKADSSLTSLAHPIASAPCGPAPTATPHSPNSLLGHVLSYLYVSAHVVPPARNTSSTISMRDAD